MAAGTLQARRAGEAASHERPLPARFESGALGTVIAVDDIGTIHVAWDDGASLGVAYGADECAVVDLEGGEALDGTDGT